MTKPINRDNEHRHSFDPLGKPVRQRAGLFIAMKPFTVADICMAFFAISWGIAGLACAWCRWKESKYWEDNKDDDEGDESGPDKPATPYDIDPQFDPSDWWKKNDKDKV